MANALQSSGANPGKTVRFAPIYTGRYFSGINTNRSPLRDARSTRYEEKFIGPTGDALIDGQNLEVTNKLTLGRRPGNPIYDTVNDWQNVLSFDDFRISKALPDIFGEITEQIDVMVSEGPGPSDYNYAPNASLSAINSSFQKQVGDPASAPAVWESASASAGQAYGVQVGNEWYFGNGVDNKKWLQSLFVRTASNNSQNLPVNTYPFMTTYYIDPNGNIEQLIGAVVQSTNQNSPATPNVANVYITHVAVADNVLTLTVSAAPYNAPGNPPIPVGTQYMIWSADNNPTTGQFGVLGKLAFLQGMTITTASLWSGTTITASIDEANLASTAVAVPDTAVLQIEQGGAASVNNTVLFGSTTPVWGTQVPSAADNFSGSITIDGQAIWVNRGETVENWGIAAPTISLATPGLITTFGAAAGNFQPGTFYAPASITQDSAGNLWLVTKPGINPGPGSTFPAVVTFAKKFDIYTVQFTATQGTVIFGIEAPGAALVDGDTFQVSRLRVLTPNDTALNTPPLILGTNLVFKVVSKTTGSVALGAAEFVTATCATLPIIAGTPVTGDAGYIWTLTQGGPHAPTVYPATPTAVEAQWTAIQTAASLVWQPNTHYYEDDILIQGGDYKMLYKGVQPFVHSLPPGGSAAGLHPTGGTDGSEPEGPWDAPVTPVTGYFFANNNVAHVATENPSFGDAVGSWPYLGYTAPITPGGSPGPGGQVFPNTPSLFFETLAAQNQPTGPTNSSHLTYLTGQTGNLFFYYVGGNGYLNIEGSPGVLTPGGAVDSGQAADQQYGIATVANIYVPLAGVQITFNLTHNSGGFFGFVGATLSGPQVNLIDGITDGSVAYGIQIGGLVGTNIQVPSGTIDHSWNDAGVVTFGAPGNYIIEIDWTPPQNSDAYMIVSTGGSFVLAPVNTCQLLSVGQDLSWPSMSWNGFVSPPATGTATPPAGFNVSPFINEISWANPSVDQSNIYWWMDIGPTSNYANIPAGVPVTISGVGIVYNNSLFFPYTGGVSGATVPTSSFASATVIGTVVFDAGTLQWIFVGQSSVTSSAVAGTITALGPQGFVYGIALVNTLDNTVSNLGPTNEINGVGIEIVGGKIAFAPGAGLNITAIDPQADYVAIFRTVANGSIELLVPSNGNTIYTVPLVQYLQYGYIDNTQDTSLDILVQGATAQQNTPPLPGAANLSYFLNRIWYSIGNTVYYTTGPADPSGNGLNGTAPGNTETTLSRVTKLVPSSIGMLAFTLSDVYVIPVSNGAILPAQVYVPGVGLSSYNALDVCGTLIGFFTTDHQFVLFTPTVGVDHIGNPIANLLRLEIDEPGMDWNPALAYVSWYVNGEDMGWFLADGSQGWFRLVSTPAPEKGEAWSPFAEILPLGQGCGAIKAVEIYPGDHRLLIGPSTTGVAPTPNPSFLGSAANYAILAAAGITNTGSSVITGGDVGSYPTTSITPGAWTLVAPSVVDNADAAAALTAALAAYNYYAALTPTLSGLSDLSTGGNGSTPSTYTPGVYVGSSSLTMPTGIILDAQGNPNAIFVFISGSTVNLASGQSVSLINNAQTGNVYWVVGSSFTSVATSTMVGTILAHTSITLGGGVLDGRALAGIGVSSGAVTISAATSIYVAGATPAPMGTGNILYRDLDASTDGGDGDYAGGYLVNGTTYPAYGVFGSYVCAHPGQVAMISFITTDQVNTGSPCIIGVIFDEALPYYQGSFDILKNWVSDPPNLPESSSILGQRFYMSETGDGETAALCRHMQVMIQWPAEAALNELQSFTIYGSFGQES